MTFDDNTTLDDFRDEMQHRVVRHSPRSRPVREALRFARKNANPAFLRVAMDKLSAQQQYRREVFGPTKWERLVDVLNMGSLREVGVSLALVAAACAGIEGTRGYLGTKSDAKSSTLDVDRLAERMGLYMREDAAKPHIEQLRAHMARQIDEDLREMPIETAVEDRVKAAMENSQLGRLAVEQLNASLQSLDIEQLVLKKVDETLQNNSVRDALGQRMHAELENSHVRELVASELRKALDELRIESTISEQVAAQFNVRDQQMAEWTEQFSAKLISLVSETLKSAAPPASTTAPKTTAPVEDPVPMTVTPPRLSAR